MYLPETTPDDAQGLHCATSIRQIASFYGYYEASAGGNWVCRWDIEVPVHDTLTKL